MSQDRQLQEAVLAEFAWEPSINAAHIGVIADAGIVTLTGHVSNYLEKHAATVAATRVKGVKGVVQEMEVRIHFSAERSDEEIARVAIDHLIWDVSVPADAIKVRVEKGWVTLSGEVEWHFQKEAAERAVRGLYGVVGVSDLTTIKPKPDAVNISADINTALHRSWFDPDKVKVTASGGKVKLTGTVHSSSERWTAGSTAWGAPGATSVENDLIVA
ncbi:BON domain-containing protein [Sphingomonas sp. PAMC26645]|uniref:BON domain-containing protein n=1 Tax=Sphingomonas sp. PAMC26645 TaxID=2565555 RepID=UPI00109DA5E6|nr:BON domain-containing protein [Sphingomonas sp. PAMC26645]QCB42622.1 BON domain-containing protein [Sphingomonas sp. PAMC26645]